MKTGGTILFAAVVLSLLAASVWGGPYWCPDLSDDDFVGFADFAVLAGNWMQSGDGLAGDFDDSGTVDMNDLDYFVDYWLTDVDCPDYYPDQLPYMTSFEDFQGFETDVNDPCGLDYQEGWEVRDGNAEVGYHWAYESPNYFYYQFALVDEDSTVVKSFTDNGDHDYIRFSFIPAINQKIDVVSDSNVVASVWFASNGYIYVLDDGTYADANVYYGDVYNSCWYFLQNTYDYDDSWTSLMLKMNWSSNTYEVYWDGDDINDIADQADFESDHDILTDVKFVTGGDWFVLNSMSISNESSSGGVVDDQDEGGDIYITSPCACTTDELTGRVAITGKVWWERLGVYKILFCPADLDYTVGDNWIIADVGWNVVPDGGILGYWDTSLIPNGYYHLAIIVYNDLDYTEQPVSMMFQDIYYGSQFLYSMPANYAVAGDLKSNTFFHAEQADISVPWSGEFPFELRRIYNNNRRFYKEPWDSGWSERNHQLEIVEVVTNDNCDDGSYGPAYDGYMLGFGEILVTYPDGSTRVFEHTSGDQSGDTSYYYPKSEYNTGDIIKRRTDCYGFDLDLLSMAVGCIHYELTMRDGTVIKFSDVTYFETELGPDQHAIIVPTSSYGGGKVGWKAVGKASSMADRFGNTLNFNWIKSPGSKPVELNLISHGNTVIDFSSAGGYYTKAELKVNGAIYRTVRYDWNEANKALAAVKTGYGVDANGVYDGGNLKECVTKYQYEEIPSSGYNLVRIAYSGDLAKPSIEVEYGDFARVDSRKDYVDPNNSLVTTFDYSYYHPDPNDKTLSYLKTTNATAYGRVTSVQDDEGNLIEQKTIAFDGSPVTDVNSLYADSSNPLKPTDVNEYFDGMMRRTRNDFGTYGDLVEQRVYLDDSNYVATEYEYHPKYSLVKRQESWQGLNKTGPEVEKVFVYGNANGVEDQQNGVYLVKAKTLLAEENPTDIYAVTSYEYQDNGLVEKQTDPNGFVTFYEYDVNDFRKLVKVGTADFNEPVQRLYHDAIGQLRIRANHLGGVILSDYDDFGRLWRIRKYEDSDAMSISDTAFVPGRYEAMTVVSTASYGYDQNGNRTYEQRSAGGEVLLDHTRSGLPKEITYDDGSYLEYYYDSRGLKIEEWRNETSAAEDWGVERSYDDMGRLVRSEWYDYDDVSVIRAETSEYYGSGNKKSQTTYGYSSSAEERTDYYYDVLGRLTTTVVAPDELDLTTSYEYDAAGNRTGVIDPNGNIIYFDYDNANRKIGDYFAAEIGSDPNISKEIRYYENGRTRDVNSYDYDGALLARSRYEYDARGRVTKVTQDINDVEQAETVYDYNDSGFVVDSESYQIRTTDAEGKYTYTAQDEFGRTVKTLYPSEDYQELLYNGDGTLAGKAVWDANDTKHWIEYYYDGYARLIDTNYPDGGNVHYTYDGFGRKTLVEDNRNSTDNIAGSGEIAYEYDVLGRVDNIIEQDGYRIGYGYQAGGQKSSITVAEPNDPNSIIYSVDYSYDAAGRLLNVIEPQLPILNEHVAEFEYDENGNRKKTKYFITGSQMGATVSIDYAYDLDNHLTGFTTTGGPTFTLSDTTIDGLGRLLYADEAVTKNDSNTVEYRYEYEYDMRSSLIFDNLIDLATSDVYKTTYTYDLAGNMLNKVYNDGVEDYWDTTYTYDGDQVVQTAHLGGGQKDITWDENGRQTAKSHTSPSHNTLEYDWDGRLRAGDGWGTGLGMEARYTPDGVRIAKKRIWNLSSYDHKYIVDMVGNIPNILLVLDANDNNAILRTYVHANDQILMQHDGDVNSPSYFYLHDRLGSVRQLINSDGDVENHYFYDSWGYDWDWGENITNLYEFAGYYVDSEVSQFHCNARQYEILLGRFTSRDPIRGSRKEPTTLHAYLYCLNDPVNRTDPSGQFAGILASADIRARNATASVGALEFARRIVNQAQLLQYKLSMFVENIVGRPWGQSLRANLTRITGKVSSKLHAHHVLPQLKELAKWFKLRGIENIHDPMYGMWVDAKWHLTKGFAYNQAWLAFMESNPQATVAQIHAFAKYASATIMQCPTFIF